MGSPKQIAEYMSTPLFSVAVDQSVAEARKRMDQHSLRHLAVLRGENLVGVVSDRDLCLLEGFLGANASAVPVEEVMSSPAYAVDESTSAQEVFEMMARRRLGAAIVSREGVPHGIVTSVDAMSALARCLGAA